VVKSDCSDKVLHCTVLCVLYISPVHILDEFDQLRTPKTVSCREFILGSFLTLRYSSVLCRR
jgi:hypothetical protein